MEDKSRIGCATGTDKVEEVIFYDSSYEPPIGVTAELAHQAGLTAVQLERYEMFASGLGYKDMSDLLGVSAPALRNSTEKARYKLKNVFRARGLVKDGVPVPIHRGPTEVDERVVRAMKVHGIKR